MIDYAAKSSATTFRRDGIWPIDKLPRQLSSFGFMTGNVELDLRWRHRGNILASHTAAPGLILGIPKAFFSVAEIYRWRWLEESGQRLENDDWTHLVLASGKLVPQNRFKVKGQLVFRILTMVSIHIFFFWQFINRDSNQWLSGDAYQWAKKRSLNRFTFPDIHSNIVILVYVTIWKLLVKMGSGGGSVGRAVASDIRVPQFKSQHRQSFIDQL